MWPLIHMSVASVVGILVGKKIFPTKATTGRGAREKKASLSFQVLRHAVLEEKNRVLATEEVPLDNRFGGKVLESEHEFSHSATVVVKVGREGKSVAGLRTGLWKLLESRTEGEVAKSLGIETGSRITRRVRLRFATNAGQFVRYRVIWSQQSRRGLLTVRVGRETLTLPYFIAYGLSHAVESLPESRGETLPSAVDPDGA